MVDKNEPTMEDTLDKAKAIRDEVESHGTLAMPSPVILGVVETIIQLIEQLLGQTASTSKASTSARSRS